MIMRTPVVSRLHQPVSDPGPGFLLRYYSNPCWRTSSSSSSLSWRTISHHHHDYYSKPCYVMLSSSPSFKGTLKKSFSSYLPRMLRWRSDKRGCIRPITITIINHHCHINHCHQHPDLIRGVVFRLIKQASHDVDNHRYEIEKRHTVSAPLTSCNINLSQEIFVT